MICRLYVVKRSITASSHELVKGGKKGNPDGKSERGSDYSTVCLLL